MINNHQKSVQRTRSRGWCLTINNPTTLDHDSIVEYASTLAYAIVGAEFGEMENVLHYQIYLYHKNPVAFSSMKKRFPRAHIEKAQGSPSQNKTYCAKEGNFTEWGECPLGAVGKSVTLAERAARNAELLSGRINDLVADGIVSVMSVPALKKARDILQTESLCPLNQTSCKGVWIHGAPSTGKSHWVREKYGSSLFIKQQNKWWDGYNGEENVLLDDFDFAGLGHLMKIWTDRYGCSGEIKGGTINLAFKRFFITSNYTPQEIWKDDDMMARAISSRCLIKRFAVVYQRTIEDVDIFN